MEDCIFRGSAKVAVRSRESKEGVEDNVYCAVLGEDRTFDNSGEY